MLLTKRLGQRFASPSLIFTLLTHRITDTAILTWKQGIVPAFKQLELCPAQLLAENSDKHTEFGDLFNLDLEAL